MVRGFCAAAVCLSIPIASAGAQVAGLSCIDWMTEINGETYRVKDVYVEAASPQTRLLIVADMTVVLSAKPGATFVHAPCPVTGHGNCVPTFAPPEAWDPLWLVDTYVTVGGDQWDTAGAFWWVGNLYTGFLVDSGASSFSGAWFLLPACHDALHAGPDLRTRIARFTIRDADWIPGATVAVAVNTGSTTVPGPCPPVTFKNLDAVFPWSTNPGAVPVPDEFGSGSGMGSGPVPETTLGLSIGHKLFWRSGLGYLTGWTLHGTEFVSASAWAEPIPSQLTPVGSADLDGDGDADFLFQAPDGAVWMWEAEFGILAAAHSLGSQSPSPSQWQVVGLADLSGDGVKEIILRRGPGTTRTVRAWSVADGAVVSNTLLGASPGFELLGIGDFNGDGRDDFLWRLPNGVIMAWRVNANLTTTTVMLSGVPQLPAAWTPAAILDLDGDGVDDVLWHNTQTGQVNAWLIKNFARVAGGIVSSSVPSWWKVIGATDLDDDGKADVVWRNSLTGQVNVWCMSGVQRIANGPVGSAPVSWKPIALTAD